MFIATGAGSGRLPLAPGTWGSAVGVLLWLAIGLVTAGFGIRAAIGLYA